MKNATTNATSKIMWAGNQTASQRNSKSLIADVFQRLNFFQTVPLEIKKGEYFDQHNCSSDTNVEPHSISCLMFLTSTPWLPTLLQPICATNWGICVMSAQNETSTSQHTYQFTRELNINESGHCGEGIIPCSDSGWFKVWYASVVCDLHVYVCLSESVCEN